MNLPACVWAIEVGGRSAAVQVIAVLARLIEVYGTPRYLRSDSGPEFVAHAVKAWLSTSGIDTAYIEPGKPWQDGAIESFIGKFRDACRDMEWFVSRLEARVIIEGYRRQYNAERPHSSLQYRTPAEGNAAMMSRPAAQGQAAACEPRQFSGLTLPVVR